MIADPLLSFLSIYALGIATGAVAVLLAIYRPRPRHRVVDAPNVVEMPLLSDRRRIG